MKKDSYHHKNLKKALIEKATEQLDADPEADISLRALAREIGVSAMAPYAHFNSKAELLDAVALSGLMLFRDAWLRIAAADLGFADRLSAYCQTYLDISQQHPGLFHQMFSQTIRPKDHPIRIAAEENAVIIRNSIAAQMPGAGEAAVVELIDILRSVAHGVAVLTANQSLLSSIDGSVDATVLVQKAVEAMTRQFERDHGA